ncbi:hypothetical protein I552_9431 [Mycobacterium xenopi 3993]|nr:hypothetical protein I552_9431 [Mycobacterium xenopi 3993]
MVPDLRVRHHRLSRGYAGRREVVAGSTRADRAATEATALAKPAMPAPTTTMRWATDTQPIAAT